jgi:hypothetical protein
MRPLITIFCLVLAIGCRSTPSAPDSFDHITEALERPVTNDQAVELLVGEIDRSIVGFETRAAAGADSADAIRLLTAMRQKRIAELDALLKQKHSGDELWEYRTYATPDKRCGCIGIALVRSGAAVAHMEAWIVD